MYIGDPLARTARDLPSRLAVVDVEKGAAGRISYAALDERASRLAGWLRSAGVQPGERVALLAQNGVEHLDALFACSKLGAIFFPYNFRLHARELAALTEQVRPRVLIFSDEFREAAATLLPRLGGPGRGLHLSGGGLPGSAPYGEALAAPPAVSAEVRKEDTWCLLLTGGTTGLPKAAQLSYRMVAWNTLTTLIHELQRDDITVVHTPMFHTGGLFVYAVPLLLTGGTVILMRRWEPDRLLRLIAEERITVFFCVPTQLQQLAASPHFASTDFSSVRFVTSGGAPLPVPLIHALSAVHRVPFKQGFGMTEFGPGVFSMGPEFAVSKAGSIGRPNAFIEACIVDDDLRPVPPGVAGELTLRGPACFSGYFNDPQATRGAFDPEGWFHTGDIARADEDGFYYIVDRKKDMFISGGENVYPVEIERALYEHPAVRQCAVIGIPDERWGQVGRAFVVKRDDVTEPELLSFLRERLARYKVPKSVVFVDELPLSPAGKILKRDLAG